MLYFTRLDLTHQRVPSRIYVVLLRGPRQTLAASHCLRSIYPVKRTRVPQDMATVETTSTGLLAPGVFGTAWKGVADGVSHFAQKIFHFSKESSTTKAVTITANEFSIEKTLEAISEGALDEDSRNLLTAIIHQWSFLFDKKDTLLDRYRTLYELLLKCQSVREEYGDQASGRIEAHDFVQCIINYDCLLLMYVGFLKRNKSHHDAWNFFDMEAWYCFLRNWSEFHNDHGITQAYFGENLNIHNILLSQSEEARTDGTIEKNELELKILFTDILMHERRTQFGECQEQEKIVHNLLFQLELTLDIISYESAVQSNMLSMNKGNPLDISLVFHRLAFTRLGVDNFKYVVTDPATKKKIEELIKAMDAILRTIKDGCIFSNKMIENMQVLYALALDMHDKIEYTSSKTEILEKADGKATFKHYHDTYGAYSIYFMYLQIQHKGKISITHETHTNNFDVINDDADLFDTVFKPKSGWTTTLLCLGHEFVAKMKGTALRDLCGVFMQDPTDFYRRRNILLGINGFNYHAKSALNESEQYHVELTQFSKGKKGFDKDIEYVWKTLSKSTRAQTLSAHNEVNTDTKIFDLLKMMNKNEIKLPKIDFLSPDNKYLFFGDFEGVTDDMIQALNVMAAYCVVGTFKSEHVHWEQDADYFFHKRSMVAISELDVRKTLDHAFRRMHTEPLIMNSTIAEKMKENIPFLKDATVNINEIDEEEQYFLLWMQLACKIAPRPHVEICDVVGAWRDGIDTAYKNSTVDNAFNSASPDELATLFQKAYKCKQGIREEDASKPESYGQRFLKQENVAHVASAASSNDPAAASSHDPAASSHDPAAASSHDPAGASSHDPAAASSHVAAAAPSHVAGAAPPALVVKNTETLKNLELLWKAFALEFPSEEQVSQAKVERSKISVSDYSRIMEILTTCGRLNFLLEILNKETGADGTDISMSSALTKTYRLGFARLSQQNITTGKEFEGTDNSTQFTAAHKFYDFLHTAMVKVIQEKYGRESMKGKLLIKYLDISGKMIYCHTLDLPDRVPLIQADKIEDIKGILSGVEDVKEKIQVKMDSMPLRFAHYNHDPQDDAGKIVSSYISLLSKLKKQIDDSTDFLQKYIQKHTVMKTHNSTGTREEKFFLDQVKQKSDFIQQLDSIVKEIEQEIEPEDGKEHYLGGASEAAFGNDNLVPEPQAWAPHSASAADALRIPWYPFPQIMPPYTLEHQRWAYGQAGTGNFLPVRPAQYSTPTAPCRITPDGTPVYVVYLHY